MAINPQAINGDDMGMMSNPPRNSISNLGKFAHPAKKGNKVRVSNPIPKSNFAPKAPPVIPGPPVPNQSISSLIGMPSMPGGIPGGPSPVPRKRTAPRPRAIRTRQPANGGF